MRLYITRMHFARLLHLVDSAIPTGSFAYSYGLESSIALGLVRDDATLRNYLYACLQQAASFELPFITSCFQTELSELLPLAEEYDTQLLVPAQHRASAVQGRTWLRLLASFYPEANLPEISAWFEARELPPHFTLVFGMALRRTGYALAEVQTMYLHMLLRDQLSAAIRLGLLGPLEGHRLQHDFYTVFEHVLAGQEGREYQQATRSAFLLELAQVLHENLYTKLFQN